MDARIPLSHVRAELHCCANYSAAVRAFGWKYCPRSYYCAVSQ